MYAHQVIEDMNSIKNNYNDLTISLLVKKIKSAQKFHLPDFDAVDTSHLEVFFKSTNDYENLTPPYRLCWFDYPSIRGIPLNTANETKSSKRGIIMEHLQNDTIITAVFSYIDIHDKWLPSPFAIAFKLNGGDGQACHVPLFKESTVMPKEKIRRIEKENDGDRSHVLACIEILNCKNVGTINNNPDKKLNKKRKKRGKQELFIYKTLVLLPVGNKQRSIKKDLWENKIHLCRGHFKTYTEGKPLFGHITGRFWWQPTVRGRNREGVVMKDYELRTA